MRTNRYKIFIPGFILLVGLIFSGYSLLTASLSARADEYLPTDFLEEGDRFRLIIDIDSHNYGAVTYSYEFAE